MTATIVIDGGGGELRLAVLKDDRVTDLYYFRDRQPCLMAAVYLARVCAVSAAHNGAFLNLDGKQQGFLKLRRGTPPVVGSALRVEVRAEGCGDKLPICTLDAKGAESAPNLAAPTLISAPNPPWTAILSHYPDAAVIADSADLAALVRRHRPQGVITVHRSATGAFEDFGVEAEISSLIAPALPLPSGGALRVAVTPALTAIDVDLGAADGRRATLTVNREAAREIAHQLRLRRIAGLVVIDFLKMNREDEATVVTDLKAALAGDPTPTEIGRFSHFGLLELRRPRRRRPLMEDLTTESRLRFSAETMAYAALRAARRALDGDPGGVAVVRAHGDVVAWLQGHLNDFGHPLLLETQDGWAMERLEVYTRRP